MSDCSTSKPPTLRLYMRVEDENGQCIQYDTVTSWTEARRMISGWSEMYGRLTHQRRNSRV